MRTLLTRVIAALILVAAVAGCAGTMGTMAKDETAIEWLERTNYSGD